MSGLEVVVAVANIVSGFGAGFELFRRWKKRRALKADGAAVENSLSTSGPLVQSEFDDDFAKLGARFANGDDIARSQLQSYLITLQQSIIQLLNSALNGEPINVQLSQLLVTSDAVRNGSIRTLAEQFQRMMVSGSIHSLAPSISSAAQERERRNEQYCPAAKTQQRTGIVPTSTSSACSSCMWGHANYPPVGKEKFIFPDIKIPEGGMEGWEYSYRLRQGATHDGHRAFEGDLGTRFKKERYEKVKVGFLRRREVNRRVSVTTFVVPHRFFVKSHLRVLQGAHKIERYHSTSKPVYGCLLCDRKGVVQNFAHNSDLARHLERNHQEHEYAAEIDIEQV